MNAGNVWKFPPDYLNFLRLLEQHQVQYMIVGGWATGLHGHPRYTKDIDILIARNPDNAAKLITVINDFGFGDVVIELEDFLKEGYVIQLGYEPNRIDILTDIDGVLFDEAEKRIKQIALDDEQIEIALISLHDLIAAKRAAGRPQDLADVVKLEKIYLKSKLT